MLRIHVRVSVDFRWYLCPFSVLNTGSNRLELITRNQEILAHAPDEDTEHDGYHNENQEGSCPELHVLSLSSRTLERDKVQTPNQGKSSSYGREVDDNLNVGVSILHVCGQGVQGGCQLAVSSGLTRGSTAHLDLMLSVKFDNVTGSGDITCKC